MNGVIASDLLRRVDGEVCVRWPGRLGFLFVRAGAMGLEGVWVHVRPYLCDDASLPGYRVEPTGAVPMVPARDTHYVSVFYGTGAVDLRLVEAAEAAETSGAAWLLVREDMETGALTVPEATGAITSVESALPPLDAQPLALAITGAGRDELCSFLPLEVWVRGLGREVAATVELPDSIHFERTAWHYTIRSRGAALGEGSLRLDARLRAGRADALVLEARDFAAGAEVLEFGSRPRGGTRPLLFDREVCVTVVFDRTTLDTDAWPAAFARLVEGEAPEEAADALFSVDAAKGEARPERWNAELRAAVGSALAASSAALHDKVALDLWWFADVQRDGIGASGSSASLAEAWGRTGRCAPSDAAASLLQSACDWASGLDLFDAADEALEQVALAIGEAVRERGEQRVVIVVGDSPPPPSGPEDPLWRELVDGSVRTNARRSGRFAAALSALGALGVPVAWLYVRSTRAPKSAQGRESYVRQFPAFQSLKERTLSALGRTPGLLVEGAGPDETELRAALERLFGAMRRGSDGGAGMRLLATTAKGGR